MACLLDTGVLLRAFDGANPETRSIRRLLRALLLRPERLVVSVQNVAEFWNVATRPADRNGYGLSSERVARQLALIERVCDLVVESAKSYRIWKELLSKHAIAGVAVHDARLVSVMMAQGISTIYTLNSRDFRRYGDISVLDETAGA